MRKAAIAILVFGILAIISATSFIIVGVQDSTALNPLYTVQETWLRGLSQIAISAYIVTSMILFLKNRRYSKFYFCSGVICCLSFIIAIIMRV